MVQRTTHCCKIYIYRPREKKKFKIDRDLIKNPYLVIENMGNQMFSTSILCLREWSFIYVYTQYKVVSHELFNFSGTIFFLTFFNSLNYSCNSEKKIYYIYNIEMHFTFLILSNNLAPKWCLFFAINSSVCVIIYFELVRYLYYKFIN